MGLAGTLFFHLLLPSLSRLTSPIDDFDYSELLRGSGCHYIDFSGHAGNSSPCEEKLESVRPG